MKSKGFKIIVGVLVAIIVVLGGLLVVKTMGLAGGANATTQGSKEVPEGAVADDPSLPLPPEGKNGEIITVVPKDNNEA